MINIFAVVIDQTTYYIISGILALLVLLGIYLMSKVEKAKIGNAVSAFAILAAVVVTVLKYNIIPVKNNLWLALIIYAAILVGTLLGLLMTFKIKMIQMPQLIALLNGLGGFASLIVGSYALLNPGTQNVLFNEITAIIAIIIGGLTFLGSLVAAGKLHQLLPQKPIEIKNRFVWVTVLIVLTVGIGITYFFIKDLSPVITPLTIMVLSLLSLAFGYLFTIGIGGADMPIVIALLNSFSGVAGAVSGLAINDVLLVSVGAIVGASGLLLTQIMCKAMNRSLIFILLGKTTTSESLLEEKHEAQEEVRSGEQRDVSEIINEAKDIIIVPGYGLAVAQAQHILKQVADAFKKKGASVRYAIHPVAGRMPGHMNVLLVEANVDYEDLYEMDQLNDSFKDADLAIVVGANDVLNPAARTAKDTPIYNMPILNVDETKEIFIFNYDLKPGYSGVDNPLYKQSAGVTLFLGNALDTLEEFLKNIKQ